MIQTITGVSVAPTKPIVGANAFAHEAGIHQHGVMANKETYEIMTPESVGIPKNAIVLGKHSGRHAFEDRLRELGYSLDKEKLDKTFEKFKVLGGQEKGHQGSRPGSVGWRGAGFRRGALHARPLCYQLRQYHHLDRSHPRQEGPTRCSRRAAVSDGPINAAFRAINKIVDKDVVLEDYTLRSMTDGEDAQAEAIAKISIDGSEIVTGRGVSTDVIEASIKAYINGINKYFID